MRCKNCGWPNKPNETNCAKCNSPLISVIDESDIDYSFKSNTNTLLNKTIRESDVFGGNNSLADSSNVNGTNFDNADKSNVCPKCGYPIRQGSEKCPNCKFQLNGKSVTPLYDSATTVVQNQDNTQHVRPTRMDNDGKPGNNYRGTINPYMMNLEMEPTFVLKPLKRMEERRNFDEQEYEGKEVILNRNNTEKNNPSITSHQQAIITNTDGHWYIEDKSEQKTTFVQAASKIELHDGDIILLGNRLFEFHK